MTAPTTQRHARMTVGLTTIRWLAVIGLLGGLLQVLGGLLETFDRVQPGEPGYALRTSLMGAAYLLFLAPLIGLSRSGLAPGTRLPRLGLLMSGTGWVLYSAAQFALQLDPGLAERILFPIGTVAIGAGMIIAGIGVIRARRWNGWPRFVPLGCGLYPFAVLFPAFALTGGPNFLVLSGWGLCWLVLAVVLHQRSAEAVGDPN